MTQTIDPIKLKAAAEHLEWVCQQYPDVVQVQELYNGLQSMIAGAKFERITDIVDMKDMPFNWAVNAEGLYDDYKKPNVRSSYVQFSTEMGGGLTEEDLQMIADIELQQKATKEGHKSLVVLNQIQKK